MKLRRLGAQHLECLAVAGKERRNRRRHLITSSSCHRGSRSRRRRGCLTQRRTDARHIRGRRLHNPRCCAQIGHRCPSIQAPRPSEIDDRLSIVLRAQNLRSFLSFSDFRETLMATSNSHLPVGPGRTNCSPALHCPSAVTVWPISGPCRPMRVLETTYELRRTWCAILGLKERHTGTRASAVHSWRAAVRASCARAPVRSGLRALRRERSS
jgi:hypothetical protein